MVQPRHRREFLKIGAAIGSWFAVGAQAQEKPASKTPGTTTVAGQRGAGEKRGKRVCIVTDLEGVAGVLDHEHWCRPESRYYEQAKEFLTLEVNAAIEGFARSGATEFLVIDGHGPGAIHPKLLDPRAELARNWPSPPYPFGLENGVDFVAWIGQHAMSRTEYAHLAHTGSFNVFETTVNGTPVGEFGEVVYCASQLGIRAIFGAGDLAFTKEAQTLTPGIETVDVKRGVIPGRGDECTAETYGKRNLGAVHYHPERARDMIRAGAERAIRRALAEPGFGIAMPKPPFEKVTILRPQGQQGRRIGRASHPDDLIALMNAPVQWEPLKK